MQKSKLKGPLSANPDGKQGRYLLDMMETSAAIFMYTAVCGNVRMDRRDFGARIIMKVAKRYVDGGRDAECVRCAILVGTGRFGLY